MTGLLVNMELNKTHSCSNDVVTQALRHEAGLKSSSGGSAKRLRAWQRACAFLQAQLSPLKSDNGCIRDDCLRLLLCCEDCAVSLHGKASPILQYQATLQYHFVRLFHQTEDFKRTLQSGLRLSNLLRQQLPQPWVLQLLKSCLTAIVSASYHIALDAAAFGQCAIGIAFLRSSDASQLARKLIVAQVTHCGLQQLDQKMTASVYSLLSKYAAELPDVERIFSRLVHSSSDEAVHDLISTMVETCTASCAGLVRIVMTESIRRPSMFESFPPANEALQILFVAQAAGALPSRCPPSWLAGLSDMLIKLRHSKRSHERIIALDVCLKSAVKMMGDSVPREEEREPELQEHAVVCRKLLLTATAALCDLCLQDPQASDAQKLSTAIVSASAFILDCYQPHSCMFPATQETVLHYGQHVMEICLSAIISLLEVHTLESSDLCALLACLRCALICSSSSLSMA